MNVKQAEKTERVKIRHGLRLAEGVKKPSGRSMPNKTRTAKLKIINGRGYYYEIWYTYDPETKTSKQHQKYLGKELPRGYRLIK